MDGIDTSSQCNTWRLFVLNYYRQRVDNEVSSSVVDSRWLFVSHILHWLDTSVETCRVVSFRKPSVCVCVGAVSFPASIRPTPPSLLPRKHVELLALWPNFKIRAQPVDRLQCPGHHGALDSRLFWLSAGGGRGVEEWDWTGPALVSVRPARFVCYFWLNSSGWRVNTKPVSSVDRQIWMADIKQPTSRLFPLCWRTHQCHRSCVSV